MPMPSSAGSDLSLPLAQLALARHPMAADACPRPVRSGQTLGQLMEGAVPDPVLRHHYQVTVDGLPVPAERWAATVLRDGQRVNAWLVPAGGDDGRKFIRTVLQFAVMAAALWVGGGAGGAIASSWLASAAAATVTVVGNLAINALVPLPQPGLGDSERFSPAYYPESARNEVALYQPVRVPFGEHRFFPALQGMPIQESLGADVYLRYLLSLGPMPLEVDTSSIRIGETPLSEFEGVDYELRLAPDDPPLTLYTGDTFQLAVGALLAGPGSWTTRTTQPDTTELAVVLGFRAGLGAKDSKNRNQNASVAIEIQYRAAGSAESWRSVLATASQANQAVAGLGADRLDYGAIYASLDEFAGAVGALPGAQTGPVTITRREPGKPFRHVVRAFVPAGQFDVRVRRVTAVTDDERTVDDVHWEFLDSTKATDPNPQADHAVMALRIKGSDQLSGAIDTINMTVRRKAPSLNPDLVEGEAPDFSAIGPEDWQDVAVTRNPADAALFVLQGPMVARKAADTAIHWPSLAALWKWSHDNGFAFDFVLDRPMRRDDMLQMICAAARARPVRIEGRYHFVIDAPRAGGPVQVFTGLNVRNFRVSKSWPQPVHALRIPFLNRENDYRQDERILYLPGFSADGAGGTAVAELFERVELIGVTDPEAIWKLGYFHAATALSQTERYSFDVPDAEGLTAILGDLVALQHDVLVTGLAAARVTGRTLTEGGSVTAIGIDMPVRLEEGVDYGLVRRRIAGEASSAALKADPALPLAAIGEEEAGETALLTLSGPVDADIAPEIGEMIIIGETGKEYLEGLVKATRGLDNWGAGVEAVAYAPNRFEAGEGTIPPFDPKVTLPVDRRPAAPVLIGIEITDAGIAIAFDIVSGRSREVVRIDVGWRLHAEAGAAGPYEALPSLPGTSRVAVVPPGEPSESYDVSIVAVDLDGRRSDPLIVADISASDVLAPVTGASAQGVLSGEDGGPRLPRLRVVCDPIERDDVDVIHIEARPAGGLDSQWQVRDWLAPADPRKDVANVDPGELIDVAFRARTRRGVYSPRVVIASVQVPDVVVATDAAIPSLLLEDARQLMAEALGLDGLDFDQLSGLIADRARLGGRNAVLNRVADPLFVNGVDAWKPETGGLAVLPGGAPQAIFTAGDAGEVLSWRWPVRLVVEPGDWLQASADILFAAGGSAQLVAVIRDAGGEAIATLNLGEAVSTDTRAGGVAEISRASEAGFADAAMADIELRFTAPAAGVVFIGLDRPFAGFALPGQAEPTAFLPPDAEINATIARLERAVNGTAEIAQSAQVATQQGRADVTRIDRALFDNDGFLAEALELLAVEIESDIAAVYATNEELDSAFASFEEAVAFDLSTLETSLQGEISTRASLSDLALVQSDLEGSLAALNIALSAEIDGLGSDFDLAAIAIADLESKTSSFWLRVAAGNGWAGMQAYAEDINGVQTNYFRYAAQRFVYGIDYSDAGIRDDWNYPAGYKAAYAPWGTLIEYHNLVSGTKHWYRASDGVETMNSEQGLLASGVAPFLATQGPASTTSVVNSSMTDSWLTVCEVSLNSVPDHGKFHASGHIEWVQQQSTSPIAVATVQYRVIALNASSAELEFPSPVAAAPMSWEIDPSPDPKIYFVGLPYSPFNFVVAQPAGTFTGNLVFRLQARRISGSGPISVQAARLSVTRQF